MLRSLRSKYVYEVFNSLRHQTRPSLQQAIAFGAELFEGRVLASCAQDNSADPVDLPARAPYTASETRVSVQ